MKVIIAGLLIALFVPYELLLKATAIMIFFMVGYVLFNI